MSEEKVQTRGEHFVLHEKFKSDMIGQNKQENASSSHWWRMCSRHQGKITVLIMFLMNIINVTDRYTIGSALIDIERYFDISKSTGGLLQTIFLLVYMAFSLPYGYLGDRFNRKYILITGIIIWVASGILGSLVTKDQFVLFVLSRCLFGVATASFETIAVPIIGDRFMDDLVARTRAVVIFNFGPPVGTGLAYLVGTVAKDIWPTDWRYTLRFTPFILVATLVIIVVAYVEPERLKKAPTNLKSELDVKEKSGFLQDMKILFKNKSFMLFVISWTFGLASLGKNLLFKFFIFRGDIFFIKNYTFLRVT